MGTNGPIFFWHPDDAHHAFLSQHYICEFSDDDDGQIFTSAEQSVSPLFYVCLTNLNWVHDIPQGHSLR